MRPILAALVTSVLFVAGARGADLRHFDDATLHAVQFVDKSEGWAVGDEGVVWHTIDGGKNWERQPTGVRASLRSVHFLNPFTGWIAGREELPYGAGSRGVLLYTADGGLTWKHVHRNKLPGLNQVRFLDGKVGFVLGDGTDSFPSGVFTTADGGLSWKPVPGARTSGWLAGSFSDADTGALVGRWSKLAALRQGKVGAAEVDELGGRNMRGLFVEANRAVAVGQGGLVLLSDTAGSKWGYANLKLPAEVRACWDFHAVHGKGQNIWVVGRPGSILLHSADQGETWKVFATGQRIPLNGIHFADEQRGWAVGQLGTILGTEDGGRTWKKQRCGGVRSAVLFVHGRPVDVPLDVMAALGAEEGYLAAALRLHAPDPNSASVEQAQEEERWSAAVQQVGGAAGEMLWQFPVPQHLAKGGKRELVSSWDVWHANKAAEQYVRQLVLALRMWQPAVVITDHPDPAVTGSPETALASEAIHEAFKAAGDPNVFPEQIKLMGLEPWQASKLYGAWDKQESAQVIVDAGEIGKRLEATLREYAAPARGILQESPEPGPNLRFYRLLGASVDGADKNRRLMDGILLQPGGTARRDLPPAPELKPELVKAIHTRRNLLAMAETPPGELNDADKLVGSLSTALAHLPDEQASNAAFNIASQYARMGQWTLAREVYLLMVDKYPAHPRAADAYRWLIRYNSSSEARRRHELGQFMMVTNFGFRPATDGKVELKNATIEAKGINEGVAQKNLTLLGSMGETRRWNEGSLNIGARLLAFGPLFATDPSVHICLNAARRNLGKFDDSRFAYEHLKHDLKEEPWKSVVASELWLVDRSGPLPKSVAFCRQTSLRPFLDGRFDDACWKDHKVIAFHDAVGKTQKDYPTQAWLTYDNDFLYLAIRCEHPAGQHVPPVKKRGRDDNLAPYDRVSLLLDLDRDYATYFRLEVDQRGCVCEDCWGDRNWNPRWFVACRSDETSWQIEAAIPLVELTGDKITIGKAWACNVVRTLPGRGVQAMSVPADVEPRPEGMGLLLFTPEPNARNQSLHAN
ncbi:MAG: YCF48-related protein [Gemmataceae bacterium]